MAAADSESPISPGATEVGIDDAMRIAVQMHQNLQLEGAETLYRRILAVAPDHADAMCLLGVLRHHVGAGEEALQWIRRAVELRPDVAGYRNNLGNVLALAGHIGEAAAAYEQALELEPDSADALNNLGTLYKALDRRDEARRCYQRAIEVEPRHWRACNNLGLVHAAEGDIEGAIRHFLRAIELAPNSGSSAESARRLGLVYHALGRRAEAAEVFRQWLERDPGNPIALHMHAACSGSDVPERASDAFVEKTFDTFAASFEEVLNERLSYRAPQLCADLLAASCADGRPLARLLDAGCGTGLCGPLVASFAGDLVGVDLSAGMLARARAKGVYRQLVKAELTAFLESTPATWDGIVCADTLCYFGSLEAVMRAAAGALRPGGTLVFTVEALPDDGASEAEIQPHGRYAHGRAHIDKVLAAAGLDLREARREMLRTENKAEVIGWVVSAVRPELEIHPEPR